MAVDTRMDTSRTLDNKHMVSSHTSYKCIYTDVNGKLDNNHKDEAHT